MSIKPLLTALLALLLGVPPRPAAQGTPAPEVAFLSPVPGQALQGSFPIQGSALAEGFQFAVLSFRYAGDPTGTWFELARLDQPRTAELLIRWDTANLTDGNYSLRLEVFRSTGDPLTAQVDELRIRNYTVIETNTPAPTPTLRPDEPTPSPSPTVTPVPATPTDLPPNPAMVSGENLAGSLIQGFFGGLAALVLIGLALGLRAAMRR